MSHHERIVIKLRNELAVLRSVAEPDDTNRLRRAELLDQMQYMDEMKTLAREQRDRISDLEDELKKALAAVGPYKGIAP